MIPDNDNPYSSIFWQMSQENTNESETEEKNEKDTFLSPLNAFENEIYEKTISMGMHPNLTLTAQ